MDPKAGWNLEQHKRFLNAAMALNQSYEEQFKPDGKPHTDPRRDAILQMFIKPDELDSFMDFHDEADRSGIAVPNQHNLPKGAAEKINAGATPRLNRTEEPGRTAWGEDPSKPGWAGTELRKRDGTVLSSSWRSVPEANRLLRLAAQRASGRGNN